MEFAKTRPGGLRREKASYGSASYEKPWCVDANRAKWLSFFDFASFFSVSTLTGEADQAKREGSFAENGGLPDEYWRNRKFQAIFWKSSEMQRAEGRQS